MRFVHNYAQYTDVYGRENEYLGNISSDGFICTGFDYILSSHELVLIAAEILKRRMNVIEEGEAKPNPEACKDCKCIHELGDCPMKGYIKEDDDMGIFTGYSGPDNPNAIDLT